MSMSVAPNTPKNNFSTPLRLARRTPLQAPPETPDCYTKVTVETPGPRKIRTSSKVKCDKIRNLTVAVRIRPMNAREESLESVNIIEVQDQTVAVNSSAATGITTKADYLFPYDHVFWSCDKTSSSYSDQEDVYLAVGQPMLHNAFRGYNACLLAYGQTGSGKSYSMMGPDIENITRDSTAGIIPRFCKEIFAKIAQLNPTCLGTVNVSYFEIYNEKIHDLLLSNSPSNQRTPLKVREHPVWGPYIVNLSLHAVKSYDEMNTWLMLGNKNRVTTATMMNEKSSRSHSIFSIELILSEGRDEGPTIRRSKINLVDLAGSERLGSGSNNEEKLKQGVCINKSLLTLRKVISALADERKGIQFVPYRESVLTWLLRESLGGNSLTSMLATITPAHIYLEETLATLRYACQARSVINRARVNEDENNRLIRELRLEIARLHELCQEREQNSLSSSSLLSDNSSEQLQELEELRHKLTEREEELKLAQQNWEARYIETQKHQLQQLAEVERKKEELESHVRIMSKLSSDDVTLSPYHTNFLEEVENILTVSNSNTSDLIESLKSWLDSAGYSFSLILNECGNFLNIVDDNNSQKTSCAVNYVRSVIRGGDLNKFIKSLKWEKFEVKLTEAHVNSAMKDIYNAAKFLQPHIDKEENMRLAFAKFMKSVQVLETALYNSVNVNRSKKAVTFRL